MKNYKLVIILPILAFTLAYCTSQNSNANSCDVTRVIDGDTFVCRFSDSKEEHIRLIGVDTPESKRNIKAKRDSEGSGENLDSIVAMGKEAARFTKS